MYPSLRVLKINLSRVLANWPRVLPNWTKLVTNQLIGIFSVPLTETRQRVQLDESLRKGECRLNFQLAETALLAES